MKRVTRNFLAVSISLIFMSGCTSMKSENSLTGEKEISDTATWTTIGATTGAAVGGLGGPAGALIGGAVGGLGGAYYGYSLEETRQALQEEFIDMGVSINDDEGFVNISFNNDLMFDKGSVNLSEESSKHLNTLINTVGQMEQAYYIKVIGHTDSSGTFKHNVSLSESRAKAVSMYLYNNGLNAKSIDYSGMADKRPLFEGDDEESMTKNRRVEIVIIPVVE